MAPSRAGGWTLAGHRLDPAAADLDLDFRYTGRPLRLDAIVATDDGDQHDVRMGDVDDSMTTDLGAPLPEPARGGAADRAHLPQPGPGRRLRPPGRAAPGDRRVPGPRRPRRRRPARPRDLHDLDRDHPGAPGRPTACACRPSSARTWPPTRDADGAARPQVGNERPIVPLQVVGRRRPHADGRRSGARASSSCRSTRGWSRPGCGRCPAPAGRRRCGSGLPDPTRRSRRPGRSSPRSRSGSPRSRRGPTSSPSGPAIRSARPSSGRWSWPPSPGWPCPSAGCILGTVTDLRDERGELADLEAQGVTPERACAGTRSPGRPGWPSAGRSPGVVVGLVLTVVVTGALALTAEGEAPIPPLVVVIPVGWPSWSSSRPSWPSSSGTAAWLVRRAYGAPTLGRAPRPAPREVGPSLADRPARSGLDG